MRVGLNLADHLVDLGGPGVEARSHHFDLVEVEDARLHPADEHLLVYLIDGALDEAERQRSHHQQLNLSKEHEQNAHKIKSKSNSFWSG